MSDTNQKKGVQRAKVGTRQTRKLVIDRCLAGEDTWTIAKEMGVSTRTIRRWIKRAYAQRTTPAQSERDAKTQVPKSNPVSWSGPENSGEEFSDSDNVQAMPHQTVRDYNIDKTREQTLKHSNGPVSHDRSQHRTQISQAASESPQPNISSESSKDDHAKGVHLQKNDKYYDLFDELEIQRFIAAQLKCELEKQSRRAVRNLQRALNYRTKVHELERKEKENETELRTLREERDKLANDWKSVGEELDTERQRLRTLDRIRWEEAEVAAMKRDALNVEIESYFSQLRSVEGTYDSLKRRHDSLLSRCNDRCDFGEAQVDVLDDRDASVAWCVDNAVIGGHEVAKLRLVTRRTEGMELLEAEIFRDLESRDTLRVSYHPLHGRVEISSTGDGPKLVEAGWCRDTYCSSATALQEAQGMCSIIAELADERELDKRIRDTSTRIAENLRVALEEEGNRLHFDWVRVANVQRNQDYEHLWLEFRNALRGRRFARTWHVRIACGGLGQTEFGKFPKMEFPSVGRKGLLEQWFAESEDDYGAKLELRCAYPDELDLDVWNEISDEDRRTVEAVLVRMPDVLEILSGRGCELGRGAAAWNGIVERIAEIVEKRGRDTCGEEEKPCRKRERVVPRLFGTAFRFGRQRS